MADYTLFRFIFILYFFGVSILCGKLGLYGYYFEIVCKDESISFYTFPFYKILHKFCPLIFVKHSEALVHDFFDTKKRVDFSNNLRQKFKKIKEKEIEMKWYPKSTLKS